jgi:alpha-tubulin suppressor-like RCC1 family protein
MIRKFTSIPACCASLVIFLHPLFIQSVPALGGTVVGWGDNVSALTNIPSWLNDAISVAAGLDHALALREDGTVVAWGDNGYGQTNVPASLSNVVAVSAGWEYSMALRDDGTVVTWGLLAPVVPAGLSNVVAIAAGGQQFCLALRADRTIAAWGYNGSGQTLLPSGLSNVVAIAAGLDHSLALRDDSTVTAWGGNTQGGSIVPANLTNVVSIAAGWGQSLALRADGTVVAWGGYARVPAGLSNVLAVTGGWDADIGILLKDGTVAFRPALSNVIAIAEGHNFGFAITGSNGPLLTAQNVRSQILPSGAGALFSVRVVGVYPLSYQWQFNEMDIVGGTNWFLQVSDAQVTNTGNYRVIVSNSFDIVTSSTAALTITDAAPSVVVQPSDMTSWPGSSARFCASAWGSAPRTYEWRFNGQPISGATTSALALSNLQSAQAGGFDLIVTNSLGAITSRVARLTLSPVVAWGETWSGKTLVPPAATNVIAVAAGSTFSTALRADGTVVNWGLNEFAQSNVLASLSNVIAVAAGWEHGLALRADGSLVACGYNGYRQTNVPPDLHYVVAVAGGYNFSAALRNDGTVTAWGMNDFGQTNVPPDLRNVVSIGCGQAHVLALRSDGTVVAWGDNDSGQTNVPAGLTGVTAIAAGRFHNLALRSDGMVTAWGYGGNGQTNVPPGLTNVVAIAGGNTHSVALLQDGTVRAWGWDGAGQIDVPSSVNNVFAITCGTDHSLALVGGSPPVFESLLTAPVIRGGAFQVNLRSRSGHIYALQYKNSLLDPSWTALPLVAGNGGLLTLSDPSAPKAQRFYRVLQW